MTRSITTEPDLAILEPWLTPMQAVTWIALGAPICVRRADLDAHISAAAAEMLEDGDILGDTRPGLSLLSIDMRINYPEPRPGRSAELALRQLLGALRRGEVTASAEYFSEDHPVRSARRVMAPLDWAGITLASAPGDERRLVTYRGPEISQFLSGQVLDTRWQAVLIRTPDLLARFPATPAKGEPPLPDGTLEGYLFLDDAVTAIMAQLSMPEGPAVKWLRQKLQAADIQSYKRRGPELTKCLRSAWADADIDLMGFRAAGNGGLQLDGHVFHLHRVVLSQPDLEFCLTPKVQEPADSEPAGKAQVCVPAELAAWMKQHMQDGLDKSGVLPKRNPSVKQCMEALGCSSRAGLAAYWTLPAELRRSARETDRALSVQRALARTAIQTV